MKDAVDRRMIVVDVVGGIVTLCDFFGFVLVGDAVSTGPSTSIYVLYVLNSIWMLNIKREVEM